MKTHIARMALAVVAVAAMLAMGAADAPAKDKKAAKAPKEATKKSGYIGVYMQELTDEVREGLDMDVTKGVLVSGVQDDSPAAAAGVEEGDVVVSFGGKDVDSPEDLSAAVRAYQPGSQAKMEVVRDGKTKSITLTVGDRPESESFSFTTPDGEFHGDFGNVHRAFAMIGGPRLGIDAHDLEKGDDLASYFGSREGVLVLGVEEESVAAEAGVKAGDVITSIGDETVTDIRDLRDAVRDFDAGEEFTITVVRKGKTQSL
ncbi:MAG TPA: PDZ domain-containing protein, partial [Candidatus Krumholzibacteria bacterium]|nr:PDZ domain-containing protein [Candidatus Krumholzibacteria bacterium]